MSTYITFVLDETGSMGCLQNETISNFNEYINTLQNNLKNEVHFNLLMFNSSKMEWCFKDMSINDVPELNVDLYKPNHMTPLWDAVAKAILHTEESVKNEKDAKVIMTILTDGYENMSKEFKPKQVKEMIESHKDWAFNFLGANIDSWFMANLLGVSRGSSSNFNFNPSGIKCAMQSAAIGTCRYTAGLTTVENFYDGTMNVEDYKGEL